MREGACAVLGIDLQRFLAQLDRLAPGLPCPRGIAQPLVGVASSAVRHRVAPPRPGSPPRRRSRRAGTAGRRHDGTPCSHTRGRPARSRSRAGSSTPSGCRRRWRTRTNQVWKPRELGLQLREKSVGGDPPPCSGRGGGGATQRRVMAPVIGADRHRALQFGDGLRPLGPVRQDVAEKAVRVVVRRLLGEHAAQGVERGVGASRALVGEREREARPRLVRVEPQRLGDRSLRAAGPGRVPGLEGAAPNTPLRGRRGRGGRQVPAQRAPEPLDRALEALPGTSGRSRRRARLRVVGVGIHAGRGRPRQGLARRTCERGGSLR